MNTQEAFEELLNPLCAALEAAKIQLADATAQGQFNRVIDLGKRCEELQAQIKNLETMHRRWGELIEGSVKFPKGRDGRKKSFQRGKKTPQIAYRLPILNTLVEMGGSGRSNEVLKIVKQKMQATLNEYDQTLLKDGRTPRWRNTAQWERNTMRDEGFIKKDSPTGIWEITEEGRKWLLDHDS